MAMGRLVQVKDLDDRLICSLSKRWLERSNAICCRPRVLASPLQRDCFGSTKVRQHRIKVGCVWLNLSAPLLDQVNSLCHQRP